MKFVAVLVLIATGVFAFSCDNRGPSQQETQDYMDELTDDYRWCFQEFVTRYGGDPDNQWWIDTMTGQFTAADDPTTLSMLRDQCYSSLDCPPSQSVRSAC